MTMSEMEFVYCNCITVGLKVDILLTAHFVRAVCKRTVA